MPDLTTLLSKFLTDLYGGVLGVSAPLTGISVSDGTGISVSGGSGSAFGSVLSLTELVTVAAAPTTATVIQLPAGAIIWAVSVRVVTVIPTAATFTVTSATPTKTWNTVAVAVAAGTTNAGTLGAGAAQTAASVVTVTPNLQPGTATGQVRVTVFYSAVTPATS